MPDLFVFFRKFVRGSKENLNFCGQTRKDNKKFSEFFQTEAENFKQQPSKIGRFVRAVCIGFQSLGKTEAENYKQNLRENREKIKYDVKKRASAEMLSVRGAVFGKAVCALRRIWRGTCSSD